MSPDNGRPNPYRHPLGRTCRDPKNILLALLLTLVYALPRLAYDTWKDRRDDHRDRLGGSPMPARRIPASQPRLIHNPPQRSTS